jgi:hypothetical protein
MTYLNLRTYPLETHNHHHHHHLYHFLSAAAYYANHVTALFNRHTHHTDVSSDKHSYTSVIPTIFLSFILQVTATPDNVQKNDK